jgi:flagellar FliL protein
MASDAKANQAEASTDAEDEGEAAAPKKSWLSLKLIVIVLGTLAVLGGGGAGAYYFFGPSMASKSAAAPVAKPAVFLDVPEVLVNLSNTGGERTQYLKVKIVLELSDAALTPQVQTVMPRVMDAFQTYLRELRPTDLDGSAGLYRMKEELTRRVNASIAPSRVTAVLFKEIVVQ